MNHSFKRTKDTAQLAELRTAALHQFSAPQDGMWAAFREMADQWVILADKKAVGFLSVNSENVLLNYYVKPDYSVHASNILKSFIGEEKIKLAMGGTNNPSFLIPALEIQQKASVHTYLFRFNDPNEVPEVAAPGIQNLSEPEMAILPNLDLLSDFCHIATGAPFEWLKGYYANLINRKELYFIKSGATIAGTFEVRKSDTNDRIADVGMVVSPDFRRKGVGTYLLSLAVHKSLAKGRNPICSCECGNLGSRRSIEKNGFRLSDAILLLEF